MTCALGCGEQPELDAALPTSKAPPGPTFGPPAKGSPLNPAADPTAGPPPKAGDSSGAPSGLCSEPQKPLSVVPNVYYGTKQPTLLPMTAGQVLAVGNFYGCSGLLITPTWVLTATHCGLGNYSSFCVGADASNANICFDTKRVINHPSVDLTLLELTVDARTLAPSVEPVPLFTENLGQAWIGKMAEAAGYGRQETGASNTREFTAEPIVQLSGSTMTIDGDGKQGVCFGDSGGPLMVLAKDGSVRVAGTLSNGDNSCVGWDNYTRVDLVRDWIESYTGPTVPAGPVPCGEKTAVGTCGANGQSASWCGDDGMVTTDVCGEGQRCSWSSSQAAFRCVLPADDACGGMTAWGQCESNTLSWCGVGGLRTRDCGACGETCVPNTTWGYYCVVSDCGDLTFQGECQGDTARWCSRTGAIETRSCGQYGQGCGWVDDETGFYCSNNVSPVGDCGDLSYEGRCDGTTASWCDGGVVETRDCAGWGQTCGWAGDKGYYCVDVPAEPCGELTYSGQCYGATAEWCADGVRKTLNCAAEGKSCGYSGPEKGFYCLPVACGAMDFNGSCQGDTATWCTYDGVNTRNCAEYGQTCGWHSDEKGFYCVDAPPPTGDGPEQPPVVEDGELPPRDCTGSWSWCSELIPFDPDAGPGYVDYPLNGEGWSNQYRSWARRDLVMLVKWAAAYVEQNAKDWDGGNGHPLGLGDMSEANGTIPGTSDGDPGHPWGSHTNGFDMDIAYYQQTGDDNYLRPVCPHNGTNHCTGAPDNLDTWRTALFIGALLTSDRVRIIGVDGRIGPLVESAIASLEEQGWLPSESPGAQGFMTYETWDGGNGWYYFHHHHLHLSLYADKSSGSAGKVGAPSAQHCLVPDCSAP